MGNHRQMLGAQQGAGGRSDERAAARRVRESAHGLVRCGYSANE